MSSTTSSSSSARAWMSSRSKGVTKVVFSRWRIVCGRSRRPAARRPPPSRAAAAIGRVGQHVAEPVGALGDVGGRVVEQREEGVVGRDESETQGSTSVGEVADCARRCGRRGPRAARRTGPRASSAGRRAARCRPRPARRPAGRGARRAGRRPGRARRRRRRRARPRRRPPGATGRRMIDAHLLDAPRTAGCEPHGQAGGRSLGDVLGQVAAALELGHDPQHRHQVAHVARHRASP